MSSFIPLKRMNNPVSASDFAQALFSPRAIALVGASGNLEKNTARPMRFMRKHGFQGKIYPINRTQSEIMGEPAYAGRRASSSISMMALCTLLCVTPSADTMK
jgi:hypothetical protein